MDGRLHDTAAFASLLQGLDCIFYLAVTTYGKRTYQISGRLIGISPAAVLVLG